MIVGSDGGRCAKEQSVHSFLRFSRLPLISSLFPYLQRLHARQCSTVSCCYNAAVDMSHDEGYLASFNIQTQHSSRGIQHSVWDQTSTYMQEHPSQKSKLFWCGSTLLRQHLQFRVDYAILVEKEYKYARMDQYTHVASKISTSQRPRREY
jgi:hypothetical protein